jgi:general secretion pathway protein L
MRILGLDIGSTSIKAVEVDTAFGRFEIHEYHEVRVNPGESAIAVAGGLVRSLPKSPDRVIVPLRASRVTLRNLRLPTRDKKAIQSSVAFELEDDLPFEADQAASDFVILGSAGAESQVHVSAALRSNLDDYLGLAVQSGVDPDTLTTEACCYRALLRKMPLPETTLERPILVVNVGHERTTIYAQFGGTPLFCREIPWGGRDISVILSSRYGLSMDAAERTKIDNGFVLPLSQLPTVSEQQRDFSETVFEAIQGLCRDIRQADLSCKNLTGHRPGMVFLTGGTSLLPGLPALLSEETKIVCQPLRALSQVKVGVTYSEETDAKFALATGAALASLTSERPFLINFRKGEFAKHGGGAEIDLSLFAKPLATLAVSSVILLVLLFTESTLYDQRIRDTNTQLEKTVKTFFGSLSPSAVKSYLSNTANLKKNIDAELSKERALVALLAPNPHSPFEFLKDISSAIPKDVVTDLMRYQVGSSTNSEPFASSSVSEPTVELEFWVANQANADGVDRSLSSKLKGYRKSELEEVAAAKGASGAAKKYKMIVNGSIAGSNNSASPAKTTK